MSHQQDTSVRKLPNIIITGTPGCGKTSHCEQLCRELEAFEHINITEFARENDCYDGFDEERNSHIVDEDKLLDALEPVLRQGAKLIDWHSNDLFPERLIDLVVVLTTDNEVLYKRLEKRGYSQSKIEENIDCEIMRVVEVEAREAYDPEIVVVLESNSIEQIDSNVERISAWIDSWELNHPHGVTNELQM